MHSCIARSEATQSIFSALEEDMKSNVFARPRECRRSFIGGSDARIIMGQDEKALIRLWQEKRGEVGPQDLSTNLIVQLGLVTEDLNRQWFERNTGKAVTDVQSRVKHPVIPWMAATLDGIVAGTGAVYEAKFMLPWSFSEEFAAENSSTTCGLPTPRRQHSPSSPGAVNGWRSRSLPIRSISTSSSRR